MNASTPAGSCSRNARQTWRVVLGVAFLLSAAHALHAAVGMPPPSAPDATRIPYPGGKIPTAAEIALGHQLFFDPRLSSDQTISCATCHDPALGLADGKVRSRGVAGEPLPRHTPSLYNLAWGTTFFWDGRATSLEEQALDPIRNPKEMNLPLAELERRLRDIPGYVQAFQDVYRKAPSARNAARAIAAFERTLVTTGSPYDHYHSGDVSAMSPEAIRGMQLFHGTARCNTCHSGPNFTDQKFHNTGVRGSDTGRAAFDRVGEFRMEPYPFFQMRKAFKTPGLRNAALSAPYFHDGSQATLADVIDFYDRGGDDRSDSGLALDIEPLDLSSRDKTDLIAFLEALTAPVAIERPVLPGLAPPLHAEGLDPR